MRLIELKSIDSEGEGLFYHLTDAQLRSKQEPDKGIFIAEGPKVTHSALDAGCEPVSLLMRKKFVSSPLGQEIIFKCGDIPVYTAEDDVLAALTGFKLQRSWVLCAMKRPRPRSVSEVIAGKRRVALLERQDRVGRKLLSTGNGRCNLTNLNAGAGDYHGARQAAQAALRAWPRPMPQLRPALPSP